MTSELEFDAPSSLHTRGDSHTRAEVTLAVGERDGMQRCGKCRVGGALITPIITCAVRMRVCGKGEWTQSKMKAVCIQSPRLVELRQQVRVCQHHSHQRPAPRAVRVITHASVFARL